MSALRKHSTRPPSGAYMWVPCPGAVHMAQHFADEDGEAALEGTAVHELFSTALGQLKNANDFLGSKIMVEKNDGTAVGFDVTPERAKNAQLAVDFCRAVAATPGSSFIERHLDLSRLHPDMFGHLDFGHAGTDGCLTVVDYKNGRLSVDAADDLLLDFAPDARGIWQLHSVPGEGANWQLSLYAIGLALTFANEFPVAPRWVRICIVQPNDIEPGPRVKQVVLPFEKVMAMATAFSRAAHAADLPSPPFRAGSHCKFCPAFGLCKASRSHVGFYGNLLSLDFERCDARHLRALFDELPILKQALKKAEAASTSRMLGGEPIGDLKLVTTTKHRVFTNEAAVKMMIANQFGASALECPTPAQLEKLGAAGKAFVQLHATTPPGEPVAALPSDKRKPYVARTLAQIFGG